MPGWRVYVSFLCGGFVWVVLCESQCVWVGGESDLGSLVGVSQSLTCLSDILLRLGIGCF